MVGSQKTGPVLRAALGAASGYYGLGFLRSGGYPWASLVWWGIIALCSLICLFRVLAAPPVSRSSGLREAGAGLCALALGFSLGLAARGAAASRLDLGLSPAEVLGVAGFLGDDPRALEGDRGMGTLELRNIAGAGGFRASARGNLRVFFPPEAVPRVKAFGRGAGLYLEGRLVPAGEGFLFRASAVHITRPAPALEQLRTALRTGLTGSFAPHAWGGLASALLLGVKDNLDGALAGAYRKAGCSHVLALSGMHLAVVSSLLAFFLRKPLGLRAAALGGAVFIGLYVFLVGAQPSLIRAAVMYLLGVLALLKALPRAPLSVLGLSFLVQLAIWPASGDSASFILSSLALGGILSAGEALHGLGRGFAPEALIQPLAASLGAFIATAGVTAAFFGELRPVGIPAGLIIVPMTTVFMIAALAFPALNFAFPLLGGALGKILSLWYAWLESLTALAARTPGIPVSGGGAVLGLSLAALAALALLRRGPAATRTRLAPFEPG
jgi:competence protein ComEC